VTILKHHTPRNLDFDCSIVQFNGEGKHGNRRTPRPSTRNKFNITKRRQEAALTPSPNLLPDTPSKIHLKPTGKQMVGVQRLLRLHARAKRPPSAEISQLTLRQGERRNYRNRT
jgi:hypothetical protein